MKAWWLRHALTPKRKPSDTRSFVVRLLTSIRPVVAVTNKGLKYIGIKGGAEF